MAVGRTGWDRTGGSVITTGRRRAAGRRPADRTLGAPRGGGGGGGGDRMPVPLRRWRLDESSNARPSRMAHSVARCSQQLATEHACV